MPLISQTLGKPLRGQGEGSIDAAMEVGCKHLDHVAL